MAQRHGSSCLHRRWSNEKVDHVRSCADGSAGPRADGGRPAGRHHGGSDGDLLVRALRGRDPGRQRGATAPGGAVRRHARQQADRLHRSGEDQSHDRFRRAHRLHVRLREHGRFLHEGGVPHHPAGHDPRERARLYGVAGRQRAAGMEAGAGARIGGPVHGAGAGAGLQGRHHLRAVLPAGLPGGGRRRGSGADSGGRPALRRRLFLDQGGVHRRSG